MAYIDISQVGTTEFAEVLLNDATAMDNVFFEKILIPFQDVIKIAISKPDASNSNWQYIVVEMTNNDEYTFTTLDQMANGAPYMPVETLNGVAVANINALYNGLKTMLTT